MGLWNDDGQWCKGKENIAATAVAYFEKIYTTTYPTRINEVISFISRRVTEDINTELTKTFTRDEVIKALQQIHPTKALGPNDMSVDFFHRY